MNLYEINEQIQSCMLIDEETGEVIGIDEKQIEQLIGRRDEKIQSLALWYKNLSAEATALKAEKNNFAKREKNAENKAESIKKFLDGFLNGEKFKSTQVNISYRNSEMVVIDDIAEIDKLYLEYAEPTADKRSIKKAIESNVDVVGAHIEMKENIQIK